MVDSMEIETTALSTQVVDPSVFQSVQQQIDEDSQLRDEVRAILKNLDRHGRSIQSILARAHSVPTTQLPALINSAKPLFDEQKETVKQLSDVASKYPYYKYNSLWTREIQNACFTVVFARWLVDSEGKQGNLMTIEQVGDTLGVPVNVKDKDIFHITIEEYLHSLISLIEELSRLCVNSVTMGDYERPMLISSFVKDLHAAFQVLNLKNDALRRRTDGIKYNVKKIEDVVYDLSLRSLVLPKKEA